MNSWVNKWDHSWFLQVQHRVHLNIANGIFIPWTEISTEPFSVEIEANWY